MIVHRSSNAADSECSLLVIYSVAIVAYVFKALKKRTRAGDGVQCACVKADTLDESLEVLGRKISSQYLPQSCAVNGIRPPWGQVLKGIWITAAAFDIDYTIFTQNSQMGTAFQLLRQSCQKRDGRFHKALPGCNSSRNWGVSGPSHMVRRMVTADDALALQRLQEPDGRWGMWEMKGGLPSRQAHPIVGLSQRHA